MAGGLQGKVALVTGGSSGIGRASALALAREGAKVVIGARRVRDGEETVRMIGDAGGEASFVRADVTVLAEVEALVSRAVETYGRLDCAFNNAGIVAVPGRTDYWADDNWERVIATNLTGVWLSMKYEVRQMLKQGKGAIVNNSSTAGFRGSAVNPAYCASKHGILGLTKSIALKYAKQGIRVNAVCPGWVRTPLLAIPIEGLIAKQPNGRLGEPEEVAAAVVWLCSDAASLVTGQSLVMDGGELAE